MDALAFYTKVCELIREKIPDTQVEFSGMLAAYEGTFFPAVQREGRLVICPPNGPAIPIEEARDWSFRLRGEGRFGEVLTWPRYPECRNFAPELVAADLLSKQLGVGYVRPGTGAGPAGASGV